MNRLENHLSAVGVPEKPKEPGPGELCYAAAVWRAWKRSRWQPVTLDAVPPLLAGRFILTWQPSLSLERTLSECFEYNAQALEAQAGKRLKTWAVPVRMIFDRDETARIVELSAKGGAL